MNKNEVKEKLKNSIIAVLRCKEIKTAQKVADTMINSGIKAIEVTFSVDKAEDLIKSLKEENKDALIGAGTVLNRKQAQLAFNSGADFIVSPCVCKEVGEFCREKDIFCCMGGATALEVYEAYKLGSSVVKLFPGEFMSPAIINSLKAPFPFIEFMPTGGITENNVKEWFEKGAFAVGAGGYLTKGITEENLCVLEERCKKLIQASK